MKKKIGLFLGSVPHSGGAFQYSQAILEGVSKLPEDEFTVIVAYNSHLWVKYLHKYKLRTISVVNTKFWQNLERIYALLCLPAGALRTIYSQFHPVATVLLREQCDLWLFPAQDRWSYMVPVPALGTIHDLMHRYEARFSEVSACGRGMRRDRHYRSMCKLTKGVMVDSEVGKRQVAESYLLPEERIHVLPYIAPRYMQFSEVPQDFEVRYKLPTKYLFYPAQFWEHKNHKNLLHAISKLKSELPDLKLVLVGSKKNAYKSVCELVQSMGLSDQIIFLGYVPDEDMPELYRRARALVMPTYFGPTNIPPLEAFEVGCPVAVSGIYGMPAQVGDAALLFDPNLVEEIVSSIRRYWIDDKLCEKLAELGKKRSSTWGQIQFNERLLKIIRDIIV